MNKEEIETKLKELRLRWVAGNAVEKHWIEKGAALLKERLERLKNSAELL